MSQRSPERERRLERIENGLAHLARLRKLLRVLRVKTDHLERAALRISAAQDLAEAEHEALAAQQVLTATIAEMEAAGML